MEALAELPIANLFKRAWMARVKLARLVRYTMHVIGQKSLIMDDPAKNIIFVHINRRISHRFVVQIIRALRALDFTIYYYVSSLRDLIQLARLDGDILWEPGVTIRCSLPERADRFQLCCDEGNDSLLQRRWQRIIRLEFDLAKPRNTVDNPVYVPFPVRVVNRLHAREEYLGNPKKIRLFFSGSYIGYENSLIAKHLKKLDRKAIVDIVRNFANTSTIASQRDLERVLSGVRTRNYYLVDTSQFRIPPENWLEVLSYVDVFLCPPGIRNPMCHNAIEAMAVGAIPLINYEDWFHPCLADGTNCFVFRDKDDLIWQLNRIKDLADVELSRMRANVLSYYDEFLGTSSLVKRINEIDDQVTNLVMNIDEDDYIPYVNADSLAISASDKGCVSG